MRKFVLCIDREAYPFRLTYHKVYRNLASEDETAKGWVRILDESGEDYLFYASLFIPVQIPAEAEEDFDIVIVGEA